MSAYLTALEKKGLDRKTNRQGFMKAETQPSSARPLLWRDKLRIEGESVDANEKNTDGNKGPDEVFHRSESMLWLAALYLEYKATIQEGVMNFMRISTCWNSSKDNTRSITKMMKTNWNGMVSLRNRKHVSQSMMIKANNKIICYLKEDQSEFLEECRRKAPKCNVKRSGGLILADCVDLSGYVPDDWRVSAGYHEKGRQGPHVKRVTTSESMSQYSEYKPNNVSNGLKHLRIPEHGDTRTCLFDRTFSD